MIDLENNINSKKSGLTLKIKVKHQGQVPKNEFSEILDLEYDRFDTKIESIAGIQPEISKVIWENCMTLSFKVNRQGHVFVSNIFDILDLENVRIDTKIDFVSCLQPEIWKVMQKSVWPWFSRSNIKVRWLISGFLRSSTLQMLESTPRSSL